MPVKDVSLGHDGLKSFTRKMAMRLVNFRRGILTSTALVSGGFLLSTAPAFAQTSGHVSLSSIDVVNFAMVIGAISAAMLSAVWLIRERGKIDQENVVLRASLADANAKLSRHEALIIDRDRQIIVWDGAGLPAEILGNLAPETGAPQDQRDFLAFGRWLEPRSAAKIDDAIDGLRASAERFDIIIQTVRGHVIEAQGRAQFE